MTGTAVRVVHGRFSARVASPSREITELIKRTVPNAGREYDDAAHEWVVYGSRVAGLLAALRAAGIHVVEVGGVE